MEDEPIKKYTASLTDAFKKIGLLFNKKEKEIEKETKKEIKEIEQLPSRINLDYYKIDIESKHIKPKYAEIQKIHYNNDTSKTVIKLNYLCGLEIYNKIPEKIIINNKTFYKTEAKSDQIFETGYVTVRFSLIQF